MGWNGTSGRSRPATTGHTSAGPRRMRRSWPITPASPRIGVERPAQPPSRGGCATSPCRRAGRCAGQSRCGSDLPGKPGTMSRRGCGASVARAARRALPCCNHSSRSPPCGASRTSSPSARSAATPSTRAPGRRDGGGDRARGCARQQSSARPARCRCGRSGPPAPGLDVGVGHGFLGVGGVAQHGATVWRRSTLRSYSVASAAASPAAMRCARPRRRARRRPRPPFRPPACASSCALPTPWSHGHSGGTPPARAALCRCCRYHRAP